MRFWKIFWSFFTNDMRLSYRGKETILSMVFFSALVVLIFDFSFSRFENQNSLKAILLMATLFGGILRLNRSFEPENETKILDHLSLIPHIAIPLYLGKWLANFVYILALVGFLSVLILVLFNVQNPVHFVRTIASPFLLGAIGFSCVGTIFSSMVSSHQRKDLLLPIMLYPLLFPIVFGVLNSAMNPAWINILVGFDGIYFVASLLVFEPLIKTSS